MVIWGIRFGDVEMVLLLVMLGAFMWYQVKLVRGKVKKPAEDQYIPEIRRQTELADRQVQVLERIAAALEKRN